MPLRLRDFTVYSAIPCRFGEADFAVKFLLGDGIRSGSSLEGLGGSSARIRSASQRLFSSRKRRRSV